MNGGKKGRRFIEVGCSIQLAAIRSVTLHNASRTYTHTVARGRVIGSAYASGLLSAGRTRVPAYVGGVFAKLWCPRAFMVCARTCVHRRTLCGACSVHARACACNVCMRAYAADRTCVQQITTRVQLETRICFLVAGAVTLVRHKISPRLS